MKDFYKENEFGIYELLDRTDTVQTMLHHLVAEHHLMCTDCKHCGQEHQPLKGEDLEIAHLLLENAHSHIYKLYNFFGYLSSKAEGDDVKLEQFVNLKELTK